MRGVLVCSALLLAAGPAAADAYYVSIPEGVVNGPAAIVGMAGANAALAEGSNGLFFNPAAAASRNPQQNKRFNADFAFGTRPADGKNDIENVGSRASSSIYTLGLAAIFANTGYGMDLTNASSFYIANGKNVFLSSNAIGLTAAQGLFGGQLMVAGRADYGDSSLYVQDLDPEPDFEQRGGAQAWSGSVGIIVRPERQRFRLGFTARAPMKADVRKLRGAGEVIDYAGLYRPWQVSAGTAIALGPRILNPRPFRTRRIPPPELASATLGVPGFGALPVRAPGRERYLVLAVDAIVTGPSPRTVSGDSFSRAEPLVAVDRPSVGIRAGAESEVLPNHLRLRVGTYYEPARFQGVSGRVHGTGSLEIHPFRLPIYDAVFVASIDIAERFQSIGLTVSAWR